MAIQSLSIEGYRGFATRETLNFAQPTGTTGSGLTALVGANNSGKSTIIEALQFLQRQDLTPPFPDAHRHSAAGGLVQIEYRNETGMEWQLATARRGGGPAKWSLPGGSSWLGGQVWVVPSRRVFDDTTYGRPETLPDSRGLFLRSRATGAPRSQQAILGERIYEAFRRREEFDAVFAKVLEPVPNWHVIPRPEAGQHQYAIRFQAGSANHPAEGVGEGIISLFWIIDALYDSKPGEIIVIDEPEVSLHPYLQRRLSRVLAEYASDRQIIYATHSPYFVDWEAITRGAHVARVFQRDGGSHIANLSRDSVKGLSGTLRDRNNPHVMGLDAREVFFLEDSVILTEGQDDVLTYRSIVKQLGLELPAEFFGWGVGGADKMKSVALLLQELGFQRVAGILDSGKSRLIRDLKKTFPGYSFVSIPAPDVRTKKGRNKRPPVVGLTDTKGKLKPEFRDATTEMFQSLTRELKRDTTGFVKA